MERLHALQRAILGRFPSLDANIVTNAQTLLVWKLKSEVKNGINFLADFNFVFQLHQEDAFTCKLVTFHGRTLNTAIFRIQEAETLPSDIIETVEEYVKGFNVCHGVNKQNVSPSEHLVECFNDDYVARSFKCRFKIPGGEGNPVVCDECQKIIDPEKLEPVVITRVADGSTLRNIKVEPSEVPFYNEFYEKDDKDKEKEKEKDSSKDKDNWPVCLWKDGEMYDHEWIKSTPPKKKKRKDYYNYQYNSSRNHVRTVVPIAADATQKRLLKNSSVLESQACQPIVEYCTSTDRRHSNAGRPFKIRTLGPDGEINNGIKEESGSSEKKEKKPKPPKDNDGKPKDIFRKICKICLRLYKSAASYEDDQKRHAKHFDLKTPAICPLCGQDVPKLKLTEHFSTQHSNDNEKLTCCIGCLLVMPNEDGALRRHVLKAHHNMSMCELCGKVFSNSRCFDVHMKCAHGGTKDHFCDRCGKAFAHQTLLEKHLGYACAMEEWGCPICAKVFSCRDKLKFHLVVHCDLKPYICRYCPYSSNKIDNICIHVKKVHRQKGTREDVNIIEEMMKVQKAFQKEQLAKVDKTQKKRKKFNDVSNPIVQDEPLPIPQHQLPPHQQQQHPGHHQQHPQHPHHPHHMLSVL